MNKDTETLKRSSDQQVKKLAQIVQSAIDEEKLIVENLIHEPKEVLFIGQSISDKVATFGGSWKFILSFTAMLLVWILLNTLLATQYKFDPFPFILMNLVLSAIAALQAPIIMMSQNRKEEKDRKRSENDFLIDMKAELAVRSLHQKMDLLLEEQIKVLFESQAKQLEMLQSIKDSLDKK